MHWNAVPWNLGDGTRNAGIRDDDMQAGLDWLDRLVRLLPDLRLVVTLGTPARRAYDQYRLLPGASRVERLAAAHPSPRVRNGHPQLWPGIEGAFARAAEVSAGQPEQLAHGGAAG